MKPHRTKTPPKSITLTNTLFPWDDGVPCFLRMPDSEYLYLLCFTTEEKLRFIMGQVGIIKYTIKQIDDGAEFISSFDVPEARHIRVILDPHFVEEGRVRFLQITSGAN